MDIVQTNEQIEGLQNVGGINMPEEIPFDLLKSLAVEIRTTLQSYKSQHLIETCESYEDLKNILYQSLEERVGEVV
jgi:tRNA U34 5-carboxymethylaminomethyl modifying enzyme MnmG/GidA